jgi:hypothetical protein
MLPTHNDFLDCAARWRGEHHGIAYEISWHGRSEYSPQGTWCYYLLLNEQQFSPDDWKRLRLAREDRQFSSIGSWHRHYGYDAFPDLEAHGGWTYGEMTVFLGKDGKEYEQVKVGCDYAHLWDREMGHPECRATVESDAKHSINLLVEMFPERRERCGFCGKYDTPDQFYTAINGARVHRSQIDKLRESGWEKWLPAEAA